MSAKIIFFLFLFVPTVFFTGLKDPFFIKEPLAQTLALFIVTAGLIAAAEKRVILKRPKLFFPMLLFLAGILFSLKNAVHKPLVFQFFFWQSLLALFYFAVTHLQQEEEKKIIFNGIALASLISALYGALQHFNIDFVDWSNLWGGRPASTFGNPNFAAGWWVMTFPLFLSKSISEKRKMRWGWAALTLLILLNLYWGWTRGAWIALTVSMVLGLVHKYFPQKKLNLFFILSAIGVCAVSLYSLSTGSSVRQKNPSVTERQFKWQTALEMVKGYPMFGVGAGNLKVQFALYQSKVRERPFFKDTLSFRATSESNVHNEYFQLWAETGTVGLVSFLFIFIFWYRNFIRSYKYCPPENRSGKLGEAAAIFSFLIFSMTNFPLHIVPTAFLLFFLLGTTEDAEKKANIVPNDKRPMGHTTPKKSLRLLLWSIFIFLTWKLIWPPLAADYFRAQAEIAANQNMFSKAELLYRHAIRLDFYRSERTAYDLGELYRQQENIEEALNAYQISVHLRNYGEVYNNIGNCYYLLGKKTEAAQNWEKAVQLGLPDANAQKQTETNLQTLKHLVPTGL